MSVVAKQRREGLETGRPANLQVTTLRSRFSEEGARQSVEAWLALATSRAEKYDLVAGQTHELALGAIKALQAANNADQKKRWSEMPYLGIGVANQVKPLVDRKVLKGAVVTSSTMHVAVNLLARAIAAKTQGPECTVVEVASYPELESLQRKEPHQSLVSH
jgi:ABC-type sugar transport system substrate-binding protein